MKAVNRIGKGQFLVQLSAPKHINNVPQAKFRAPTGFIPE